MKLCVCVCVFENQKLASKLEILEQEKDVLSKQQENSLLNSFNESEERLMRQNSKLLETIEEMKLKLNESENTW